MALEQLGYQSESGPWRCAYLMGAWELFDGNQSRKEGTAKGYEVMMMGMTTEMILSYIDIMTDSMAAQDDNFTLNLKITDTNEEFLAIRRDGILLVYKGEAKSMADCSISLKRTQFLSLIFGKKEVMDQIVITGDRMVPLRLLKYMSPIVRTFNIIEP